MGMRKSILILLVVGAFFAGTLLTPQVATADHNDALFFAAFDNLINTMVAFNTILTGVTEAVFTALTELQTQVDDIEQRLQVLEGGGGPTLCDPDGNGAITGQEMFDYIDSFLPGQFDLFLIQSFIDQTEFLVGTPVPNRELDTPAEIQFFNLEALASLGIPPCIVGNTASALGGLLSPQTP